MTSLNRRLRGNQPPPKLLALKKNAAVCAAAARKRALSADPAVGLKMGCNFLVTTILLQFVLKICFGLCVRSDDWNRDERSSWPSEQRIYNGNTPRRELYNILLDIIDALRETWIYHQYYARQAES
ncbi:Hypothetical predicted protein [Cloeon dipterum]|uniref:Uncharacterized protein n=1 Tax=Cloeon dipterum TaxID=197152 RepID=A0A8S1CDV9_9INSE|nr:Hypothetical predicted protein [Cloeon dipterum]